MSVTGGNKLKIKDREITMKFNLRCMKKFKELTGKSLLNEDDMKKMDEEMLSALLYSSQLNKTNKNILTQNEIDEEIDISIMHEVFDMLTKSKKNNKSGNDQRP